MFRNMSIVSKFYAVIFIVVVVLSSVLMAITFSEVRNGIESFAADKARSDLDLTYEYLEERFEGEWQIQNGLLMKGDHVINEDYQLADEITDITGGLITIFQEDMPVTTNLIIGGDRAVSMPATGEVSDAVLTEGERYSGQADILGTDMQTAYRPLFNPQEEVIGMLFFATSQETINSTMSEIIFLVAVAVLILTIIIGVVLFFFTRKIKRRIKILLTELQKAGEGNLQEHEADTGGDEIGQISASFAQTKNNLRTLFVQVSQASSQLASSSEQLTATSAESSKAAEEVAGTIEEISRGASAQANDTESGAARVHDLGSYIEEEQKYVAELNKATDSIAALKDRGMHLVEELIEKTKINNNTTQQVQEMIEDTNANTGKIENASGMIRSISEQTNLLALNASIEAARAGEAGKGFSVVADEIRKLAEQSNKFSEEISTIIQELAQNTSMAVEKMKESKSVSEKQTESVEKTTETFEGVAVSIEEIREKVELLTGSGEKLQQEKQEIIRIMENLSAISEENAASTEQISASIEEQTASMQEVASSSEDLARIADELEGNMKNFQY
ncbi:methyl-accepting chemotaxis protein [Alkalicoccus daliensis]|uniref:Methyl-accepting chemotaxis protein n=1 Tax=Alkalicoccus daliensis TaxID=745820 RepID=A0A1H0J4F9_9BACI|nr:methyl-accepting chemotaxis protein [Alkalicoccus daliensis]SDO38231.1 methyl-accepting chemotaxis protein [Alkalicoccus daliensis]